MILIKTIAQAKKVLEKYRINGLSIGFVPTMGALHAGHISLISNCKQTNSICVCSIFVNSTQFNNTQDFEKYPVTIEKDIDMLEEAGCDILFLPTTAEMYPAGEKTKTFELGFLETILEGAFRPGHFQGVCQIVDKLLTIVAPDTLYLGQKDYQQCMVIKKMIDLEGHKTKLAIQPTIREADGLAMSSRNMRLNAEERVQAVAISMALYFIKANFGKLPVAELKNEAINSLTKAGYKVDYVEIADAVTLKSADGNDTKKASVALVAAFLNEVRLIDNMLLN